MRILLINANTSTAITDRMLDLARNLRKPGVEYVGATARFGAAYISTRAAYAIAAHATLDAYARSGEPVDAVVVACFGDPGLRALQEVTPVPAVGMAEAACRAAASQGRRFAIVTGGAAWAPMLQEYVASLGLGDRLAGIHTVSADGGQIASDPDANLGPLAAACRAAADESDANVVVLGGAGLAGLADRIQSQVPIPIVDSLIVTLEAAQSEASRMARPFRAPCEIVTDTLGLSPALASLLAGKRIAGTAAKE